MSSLGKTIRVLAIVVLAGLLLCQGCTMHFKATDVELETQRNATYELESVDILRG